VFSSVRLFLYVLARALCNRRPNKEKSQAAKGGGDARLFNVAMT
jgi:hypothetical protein